MNRPDRTGISRWIKLGVALGWLLAWPAAAGAESAEVRDIRSFAGPTTTRVVFDLDRAVTHTLFTLAQPDRVVIDLRATRMGAGIAKVNSGGALDGLRYAPRRGRDLRVVLDLNHAVKPRSFPLAPNAQHGHRLVVDLIDKTTLTPAQPIKSAKPPAVTRGRDVVVAIDAGHGGIDPGASGPKGTQEKQVVLKIAKRLAALVDQEPGMRAVLTRRDDVFLKLRERIRTARAAKADLFVSIHADAFRDARARGASVYVLSRRGASSEATLWLANNENKADWVGGVSLDDKDDELAKVLLDLSQTATIEASHFAAGKVLRELGRLGRLHRRSVERGGFVVLKSPDIPSMLVETGFISNPGEEARLRSAAYQAKLARAVLKGVRGYFQDHAPPDTWFAQRRNLAIVERSRHDGARAPAADDG